MTWALEYTPHAFAVKGCLRGYPRPPRAKHELVDRLSSQPVANWETVVRIGDELPETEVGTWYGTPALKVRGKGFARLREDGALVVMVDFLEREALMQADPETFYITPHYQDYPAMLINLERVELQELRERVIESWCRKAPKRVLRDWEARFT